MIRDQVLTSSAPLGRRAFLGMALAAPAAAMLPGDAGAATRAGAPVPAAFRRRYLETAWDRRRLSILRRETGERFNGVYFEHGGVLAPERRRLDWLLRDVRAGAVHPIDDSLIELLRQVQESCGGGELIVTSGFRTAATNRALSRRGAARRSLHLKGQAVDFYIQGYGCRGVAEAARRSAMGGVGLYTRRGFVHVDVGEKRFWRG